MQNYDGEKRMRKVDNEYRSVLKRALDKEMTAVGTLAHEATRGLGAGTFGVDLEARNLYKSEARPQAPNEWVVYAPLADVKARGDKALNEEIEYWIKARAAAVAEAARALTRASLT